MRHQTRQPWCSYYPTVVLIILLYTIKPMFSTLIKAIKKLMQSHMECCKYFIEINILDQYQVSVIHAIHCSAHVNITSILSDHIFVLSNYICVPRYSWTRLVSGVSWIKPWTMLKVHLSQNDIQSGPACFFLIGSFSKRRPWPLKLYINTELGMMSLSAKLTLWPCFFLEKTNQCVYELVRSDFMLLIWKSPNSFHDIHCWGHLFLSSTVDKIILVSSS